MLNQTILIGRVTHIMSVDPILYEGRSIRHVTLKIPRVYKNTEGTYDTDKITVAIPETMMHVAIAEGNLIAVKGRLEVFKTHMSATQLTVMVERITTLSATPPSGEKK